MPYVLVKTRSYESVAAENMVYAGWGCFRVLVPIYAAAIWAFVSVSGIFNLTLRVFMSKEAIAHHRRTAMKGLQGGVAWAIMVGITTLVVGAVNYEPNQWQQVARFFWGTPILWGIALGGVVLSGVHNLIADAYPDKVHGNGYGLANLVALLPSVRPMSWLTYAVELLVPPVYLFSTSVSNNGGDVGLLLARYTVEPQTFVAVIVTYIVASVFVAYPIFYALVWQYDRRFRDTD